MPSKYKAEPTVIDGIKFGSKKEGRRYGELKLLQRAGEIKELECHPSYPLEINGNPLLTPTGRQIKYLADFKYLEKDAKPLDLQRGDKPIWYWVIEDCKGYLSKGDPFYRLFALKAAIVKINTGIEVRIT